MKKLIPAALSLAVGIAHASELAMVNFDTDILRARSLPQEMATHFAKGGKFPMGNQRVDVRINRVKTITATIRFDDEGVPCFSADNLQILGIAPAPEQMLSIGEACRPLTELVPLATAHFYPQRQAMDLYVPAEVMRASSEPELALQRGGAAGMFNYDVSYFQGRYAGGGFDSFSGFTELGLNVDNWALRSRQTFTQDDTGRLDLQHQYAYAQRSVMKSRTILRVGQLNGDGSLFSVPSYVGAQFIPDFAANSLDGVTTTVSGMAETVARIEVRQQATLVYSTVVPAGAFSLKKVPLLSRTSDAIVTVIESNGQHQTFSVPAWDFAGGAGQSRPAFFVGMGQTGVLNTGNKDRSSWLSYGSVQMPLGEASSGMAGFLLADRYYGVGATAQRSFGSVRNRIGSHSLNLGLRTATDQSSDSTGAIVNIGSSHQLRSGFGASFGASTQTAKYREFGSRFRQLNADEQNTVNALDDLDERRNSYSMGVNYSHRTLGSVSASYYHHVLAHHGETGQFRASWRKTLKRMSFSVNAERTTRQASDWRIYASLSMPLGKGNFGASAQRSGGHTSLAETYSQSVNDQFAYSLGSAQSAYGGPSASGSVSYLSRVAAMSASVSTGSDGTGSSSFSIKGGAVAHGGGVTLTPHRVDDTFGVASVGEFSGVKMMTPSGPAWSDWRGYAVIPNLRPFSAERIQLVPSTLPRNADIKNGVKEVRMARGSVTNIPFEVTQVRRMFLNMQDGDGHPIKAGAIVSDVEGTYITTIVGRDGGAFIPNVTDLDAVQVRVGKTILCEVALPKKQASDQIYETATAVCQQSINSEKKS
ncbi:fimbria/pilus outer membrane usher protein [Glaciimonas sp. CA11.2]|uniref:fimbria/pilus outer membrane usher protein n=1 Tax=Glaciimonas sp. CA11.2 TaxID=3048601 RepID=UPI002AB3EB70|nr:fimbria/pilus outer membrane usher protein [Glaciimonas sp. CA11.2]MDY7545874.1 fimbria/pilus outer membrane usher protein [Glaciimonas sp. CA11.2]MEB0163642.1 fimbria/pilus outer membrane usher protein [Glaciimonas sp. CA11.2]